MNNGCISYDVSDTCNDGVICRVCRRVIYEVHVPTKMLARYCSWCCPGCNDPVGPEGDGADGACLPA
jgi:hypothetical protein